MAETRATAPRAPGLGDLLIRDGLIDARDLDEALVEQKTTRERLGEILCRRGKITAQDLLKALSRQLHHRLFDPHRDLIAPAAIDLVPVEFARRHGVLPVRLDEERLIVAIGDPLDVEAVDHLERLARREARELELLLALPESLSRLQDVHYARVAERRDVRQLIDRVVDEVAGQSSILDEGGLDDAQYRAQDAGVVELVERVIAQALRERATDIHIEPLADGLLIRYRVDGMLHDALQPPRAVATGVTSRIKILANMDIAERRAPQDGRFSHRGHDREVDVRVSAVPTIHGEKLVLRLLDKSSFSFTLTDLGFSAEDGEIFARALRRPHGMILLSGPTGSGKSTTLYAGLLDLRDETRNILTVEDPVEYQIARINQVPVNERKQLTFATALRSFLRQDPDVIMVGEIRDSETAEVAVRAALTGHLVLSTIHANDAPATATRLLTMGVEPFIGASALSLVAAQRLVRRNCPQCLEAYEPDGAILAGLGWPDPGSGEAAGQRFMRGTGCAACGGRGYLGRVAIVEMMAVTPGLRQLIAAGANAGEIRELARAQGMRTLREDGVRKVHVGVTTPEEVLRVCLSDD